MSAPPYRNDDEGPPANEETAAEEASELATSGNAEADEDGGVDKRMSSMSISDIGSPASTANEPLHVTGTDRYFVPLRLACESKQSRIMEVSAPSCALSLSLS